MSKTERQQYKIAGPATWELIRAAYLGGDSARALAERFGVSEHAIRKRITVEKWSKREYAAALEARGVVREKQKPNFIEEGVLREQMRVAAEAREVAEQESEMTALVDQIALEEDASEIAAAIERRALAQASAAMVQGRSKEAQALASMAEMMRKRVSAPLAMRFEERHGTMAPPVTLSAEALEQRALAQAGAALEQGKAGDAKQLTAIAEQMRKRVEEDREAEKAAAEKVEYDRAEAESCIMELFANAAHIASCLVHNPTSAPGAFLRMIKRWREINLGEGEEDAEARAKIIAEAQARHMDGAWVENLPEDVRAYLQARWDETRGRLERGEPVGVVDKSTLRL
ncbi:MAG: hypothetical protein ABL889_17970 [Terricaulis sp.]